MKSFTVDSTQLRQLLSEAYQAGWRGSLELVDSAVDEILEREAKKAAERQQLDWGQKLSAVKYKDEKYGYEKTPWQYSSYVTS